MGVIPLDIALVVVGLLMVGFAGDRLVDYAAATARKARLTSTVIALTVIAMGTSLPELFVSFFAALAGSPEIAIANVAGSNVANVALILGLVSLVVVVPVALQVLRFDYLVMVLASWITLLLARDGEIDRLESGFFLVSMIAFVSYSILLARQQVKGDERKQIVQEAISDKILELSQKPAWRVGTMLVIALAGLGLGARVLVVGAVGLAEAAGVSERFIGLTVVAFGTSLPELVASIAAALKRQHEMAIANIVGSNMFNLLLILGVTGLVRPIPVSPDIINVDLWVMMATTILLFPLLLRSQSLALTRLDGAVLFLSYLGYMAYLFATL